jgi:hypothetical protein
LILQIYRDGLNDKRNCAMISLETTNLKSDWPKTSQLTLPQSRANSQAIRQRLRLNALGGAFYAREIPDWLAA